MDNNDLKALIEAFKGYRELLSPIQTNLHDFARTYDSLRDDIEKLNTAFGGDIKGNLEKIYKNLSKQAENASDLASQIDRFIEMSNRYAGSVMRFVSLFEKVGEKLSAVNELESKAEEQIGKLDAILEEKKKNYNVRELQRTLENYNSNVQKVSEFINKDVTEALAENNKKLDAIKTGSETLEKRIAEESVNTEKLLKTYIASSEMLKKIAEKQDVNEAYIFEILDRWAEERKVKTKKKVKNEQ